MAVKHSQTDTSIAQWQLKIKGLIRFPCTAWSVDFLMKTSPCWSMFDIWGLQIVLVIQMCSKPWVAGFLSWPLALWTKLLIISSSFSPLGKYQFLYTNLLLVNCWTSGWRVLQYSVRSRRLQITESVMHFYIWHWVVFCTTKISLIPNSNLIKWLSS